jgi:ubiquitin C-terminal hydrolase
MTENYQFKKINTPVNISSHIQIELNGNPANYKLIGIGNHYGIYGGGHYNAHVLEDNKWICFDDLNRSIINLETNNIFVNNKNAYMVCYELT